MKRLLLRLYNSLLMSLGMFTCIPVPHADFSNSTKGIMGAFPVVGVILGVCWFLVAAFCKAFIPGMLGAAIITVFLYIVTGFIHLDGFMDVCDAVMSRRPLEKRLKILKDPLTGAFAVCSLGMLLIIQFASCYEIIYSGKILMFIFVPVISRCVSALAVLYMKPIATSSLVSGFKAGASKAEIISCFIFLTVASLFMVHLFSWYGLAVLVWQILVQVLGILNFKVKFEGFSGDGAGYSLVLGELAAVVVMAVGGNV